jgi:hypothetical protein
VRSWTKSFRRPPPDSFNRPRPRFDAASLQGATVDGRTTRHLLSLDPIRGKGDYEVFLKSMRTELRLQPLSVVVVNVTTGDTPTPP